MEKSVQNTPRNALTSVIVNHVSDVDTDTLISQQQARILDLERTLRDVLQAECVLSSIHGDYGRDNMLRAADLVDTSELRFTLPNLWMHVSMNVYRGLADSYDREPVAQRSDDLYIMESEATGAVKIGRTSAGVETRVKQLKTSCPDIRVVKVFKGLGGMEKLVHRDLKHVCTGGEWFGLPADRAVTLVDAILEQVFATEPA